MKRAGAALAAGLVALGAAGSARAQSNDTKVANYVPEEEIHKAEEGKKQGLDGTFGLAANVNLASNRRVVGQVDGFSFLFGVSLIGGLDYVEGPHEVRNTLTLNESWARTPVLDEFVKSNDVIDIESVYNYFILSWFGPFARLNLESSILATEDVRAEAVTYLVKRNTGNFETLQDRTRLTLADPLQPFTLNESVGLFAEPYASRQATINIRLGFGARETFANGVLVLTDDGDTPNIEATELDNVFQGGGELFAGVEGSIYGNRLVYDVGASVLVPFLNNSDSDRSAFGLTRFGVGASVGFNVVEWMIVQYQARLLRDPQLLDDLQVQNNVLLTFQYTFIERDERAVSEADAAVDAERKRTKEAQDELRRIDEENKRLRQEIEAIQKAKAQEANTPTPPEGNTPPAPEGGGQPVSPEGGAPDP